jgi:hypothetical protein
MLEQPTPREADEVSDEDLEAASEMLDGLVNGTHYPPAGSTIGPFTVRYIGG